MKIKTPRKKLPKWLIALPIAIVLLGGYVVFAKMNSAWPFMSTDPSTQETTTPSDSSDKTDTNTSDDTQSTNPPDKAPTQYSSPQSGDSTPSSELTGVINYKSVENGSLSLRATINQEITNGTCDLALTNTSTNKTVKRSVDIVAGPSASNCNGFDIPLSDLGNGTWNITINLTSGTKHGTLTDKVKIST